MSKISEEYFEQLQDNLPSMRNLLGLTIQALGDKLGVSKQSISNYENKKTTMPKSHILLFYFFLEREIEMKKENGVLKLIYELVLSSAGISHELQNEIKKKVSLISKLPVTKMEPEEFNNMALLLLNDSSKELQDKKEEIERDIKIDKKVREVRDNLLKLDINTLLELDVDKLFDPVKPENENKGYIEYHKECSFPLTDEKFESLQCRKFQYSTSKVLKKNKPSKETDGVIVTTGTAARTTAVVGGTAAAIMSATAGTAGAALAGTATAATATVGSLVGGGMAAGAVITVAAPVAAVAGVAYGIFKIFD